MLVGWGGKTRQGEGRVEVGDLPYTTEKHTRDPPMLKVWNFPKQEECQRRQGSCVVRHRFFFEREDVTDQGKNRLRRTCFYLPSTIRVNTAVSCSCSCHADDLLVHSR